MNRRFSSMLMASTIVLGAALDTPLSADEPTIVAGATHHHNNESQIRQALARTCTLKLLETPLAEVRAMIAKEYGINVRLDSNALDSLGLDASQPVTLSAGDISLESALGLILREFDLTWVIRHDTLMITSQEEAEAELLARVYDISFLPASGGSRSLVFAAHAEPLIELLETVIEPDSWEEVGGPGAITDFAGGQVLVISQTEQVHDQIDALLASMRNVTQQLHAKTDQGPGQTAADVYVQVYPLSKQVHDERGSLVELINCALGYEEPPQQAGTLVREIANTIVVKHDRRFHQQISRLLTDIGAISGPAPAKKNIVGPIRHSGQHPRTIGNLGRVIRQWSLEWLRLF